MLRDDPVGAGQVRRRFLVARRADEATGATPLAINAGAPAELRCGGPFACDEGLEARTACRAFQPARLRIEAPQGVEPLRAADSGLTDRKLQDAQRFVINLQWHRKRMTVLAAVRE